MPLKVEFQFDFGSPNAYLAEVAIPGIERRTGVKFEYVPNYGQCSGARLFPVEDDEGHDRGCRC